MKFIYINGVTLHRYERNQNNYFLLKENELIAIGENDYLIINAFKAFGIFQENTEFLNELLEFLNKIDFHFNLPGLIKIIENFKKNNILIPLRTENEIVSLIKVNRVNDFVVKSDLNDYLMKTYNIQLYNKIILNNNFLMNSHINELANLILSVVNYNNNENKMEFLNLVNKVFDIVNDKETSFNKFTREEIISTIIELININHLKINK